MTMLDRDRLRDTTRTPTRGWVRLGDLPGRLGEPASKVLQALQKDGLADAWGRPSSKAQAQEAARWMERTRQCHWRIERVSQALSAIPHTPGETPQTPTTEAAGFVSMTIIGQAFGKSAVAVGRQLKLMGLRDSMGAPTAHALSKGLALMGISGQGQIRVRWHQKRICLALAGEGWTEQPKNPDRPRARLGRPARPKSRT